MEQPADVEIVILVALSLFVIYNLINYLGSRTLIQWLFVRFKNEAAGLQNDKNLPDAAGIEKERVLLEIVSARQAQKFDLDILVSNFEFILVAGFTALILTDLDGMVGYPSLVRIGILALLWLSIKTVGYSNSWRLPIFGKSVFSIYLLHSIATITFGFLAGLLLAGLIVV